METRGLTASASIVEEKTSPVVATGLRGVWGSTGHLRHAVRRPVLPSRSNAGRARPRRAGVLRSLADTVERGSIPYLVGGAYALERYTCIVAPPRTSTSSSPRRRAAPPRVLGNAGYGADLIDSDWLAKSAHRRAICRHDLQLGQRMPRWWTTSGSLTAPRRGARDGRVAPPEESSGTRRSSWSAKYDGADVAHLIRARGKSLDWHRLLHRIGPTLELGVLPPDPVRLHLSGQSRAGSIVAQGTSQSARRTACGAGSSRRTHGSVRAP